MCMVRGRRACANVAIVLVVSRFQGDVHLLDQGRAALEALRQRPGFIRGHLGRAADDPHWWVMVTEWSGVGAYRRALSSYAVKLATTSLFSRAVDEVSAYEVILAATPDACVESPSALVQDTCISSLETED